jgi:hypothetical protein
MSCEAVGLIKKMMNIVVPGNWWKEEREIHQQSMFILCSDGTRGSCSGCSPPLFFILI